MSSSHPDCPPESSMASLRPAKRLSLLAQNSPLAMIEWDQDLIVVGWNAAAAELFNFFEDEALGCRLDELMAKRQLSDLSRQSWQSSERTGSLHSHMSVGGQKLCRWYNTPFVVRGQHIGTLSTVVDVSHQTALSNEELRAQLRSRTQMLKHTTERLQSVMKDRGETTTALSESETRFRNLAAHVPGVLYQFCLHADGLCSFPYIAAPCHGLFDLSAAEIQESPECLLTLFSEDDQKAFSASMHGSAKALSSWHAEYKITTPTQQIKWIQMASQPQLTPEGDVVWSGMLTDVTERKQSEQQLKSAHAFLHNLINGMSDPVFVKDQNRQLILLNDAFCKFMQRSRSELLGKASRDFFPPEVATQAAEQENHVLASGQSHVLERPFERSADGQTRFISTTKTRFLGLDDSPYLLGVIRDQTEQAIAQETLAENEKRLKKLTANVPGMIYQFQLSDELEPSFPFVSSSCLDLFGLSAQQIQANASSLMELIHPDERTSFEHSLSVSAQALTDWQWTGRFLLSSGQIHWIQGQSRPEKLPDGSILWDGLLMDITSSKVSEDALQTSEKKLRAQTKQLKATLRKLKQTQSKLIQSEKMSSLGQLVAGIAHEINNPVNFIHGNLTHAQGYITDLLKMIRLYQAHYPTPSLDIQQLSNELELDYIASDLPKLLTSIKSGSDRIRQIVLSLRNFSRLDESELKKADIHEGLESTLMILSNRLKTTDARRAIEVVKAYENIPPVECYVSQLNQVFMSILTNAIDAIDEAAINASEPDKRYQIALQTFQKDSVVVIRITNNGPPIAEATARRMFDPFFTTKSVGQGTGMGLSISYQTIVELHKGTLEHTCTADQKTVFSIEIPTQPFTAMPVLP